MTKGCLIVFEGIDGSGKTTQIELLKEWVKEFDRGSVVHVPGYPSLRTPWIFTREPGGSWVGAVIREQIMLTPQGKDISPDALEHLFLADRIEHCKKVIEPALDRGCVVVTDRYWYSGMAYALARGTASDHTLDSMTVAFNRLPKPAAVVLMDGEPETLLERAKARSDGRQVLKAWGLDLELQKRVRDMYSDILLREVLRGHLRGDRLFAVRNTGTAQDIFEGRVLPAIQRVVREHFVCA